MSPPPHEQSTHQCTNNVPNRKAAIVATPTKAISDSKTTRGKLGHCAYSSKGDGSDDNNNRSMLHSAQSSENKRVTETTDTTSIARLLPATTHCSRQLYPLPAAAESRVPTTLYQQTFASFSLISSHDPNGNMILGISLSLSLNEERESAHKMHFNDFSSLALRFIYNWTRIQTHGC